MSIILILLVKLRLMTLEFSTLGGIYFAVKNTIMLLAALSLITLVSSFLLATCYCIKRI